MPEAPKESHKSAEYSVAENNRKKLEYIEDVTKNADEVQKRVLAEILSRNADVEYLKRHGLNGHTDRRISRKSCLL
ncbi:UNVERIFIED_CONTAM: Indole-3-acetic acid-amido synthetase GH3.6 [Sesamum radiatum]|uniref:Indole-3-acetic acid-amido synthetase GH3.6 n=1 Tax=Sesamum radiatum TaxID=300843 RepID=A0AAW2KHQ0_SESRA